MGAMLRFPSIHNVALGFVMASLLLGACGDSTSAPTVADASEPDGAGAQDAGDGPAGADFPTGDARGGGREDAATADASGVDVGAPADAAVPNDAAVACSAERDASAPPFEGVCPADGCPAGTICVVEIGGIAGGGGEYCAPIPTAFHGVPSCACMAPCVCTNGRGPLPETCSDQRGTIACDNGIR
jgi:hypothetical protein